jgi:hypothetical protein
VFNAALDALSRTGGLQARVPVSSPALVEMRDAVNRLIEQWDEGLADRIAAENLFLDLSKDRRKRALETLRAKVGACRPEGAFEVENALRGQWILACERGRARVGITLAPTMPPLVQHWSVREVPAGATAERPPTCAQ